MRLAAQAGALGVSHVDIALGPRAPQQFAEDALFRAALILALRRFGVFGDAAYRMLDAADGAGIMFAGRLTLAEAIAAVARGESVQFRRIVPGRLGGGVRGGGRWGNMFTLASEPLPDVFETALTVSLNQIWRAPLAATRSPE